MENRTNTITTTAETLTVNEVMDMIASTSCQRTLMKDIHFINYKYGGKLSKEELKEILATTTFKSLNAAGSFDSSKASIRTWLNSIARNEISRFLKEKRRSEARSIPYVDESDEEGNFPDEIRQMHYRLDASDVQSTGIMGKERARESLLKVQCIKEVIKSMKPEDQMTPMLIASATR